jgi:hypothetical protein
MSLADVQSIITAAQNASSSALSQAQSYSQLAQTAASTITSPGSSGTVVWSKPTVFNAVTGNVDLGTLFDQEAANNFGALGPDYLGKFSSFLGSYFPNVSACLQANSDNWICNMITNGGNGLPDAVVNMIWQRAREQIAKDIGAKRDTAFNEFGARGFTVPTGALNYRLMQIDAEAINKAADVSRETAIKNIEIQIENVKFAVQKAIDLREAAMRLAIGYVQTYLKAYDSATERAKDMVLSRYQFWNAINGYYDAFSRIEALDVEVRKTNVANAYHDNELFVKAAAESTKNKTEAALAAAEAMGKAAAAALGAQNSLAYTGDVTNS